MHFNPIALRMAKTALSAIGLRHHKTCYRDRIARLSVPCPSHKKLKCKTFNMLLTPVLKPGLVQ